MADNTENLFKNRQQEQQTQYLAMKKVAENRLRKDHKEEKDRSKDSGNNTPGLSDTENNKPIEEQLLTTARAAQEAKLPENSPEEQIQNLVPSNKDAARQTKAKKKNKKLSDKEARMKAINNSNAITEQEALLLKEISEITAANPSQNNADETNSKKLTFAERKALRGQLQAEGRQLLAEAAQAGREAQEILLQGQADALGQLLDRRAQSSSSSMADKPHENSLQAQQTNNASTSNKEATSSISKKLSDNTARIAVIRASLNSSVSQEQRVAAEKAITEIEQENKRITADKTNVALPGEINPEIIAAFKAREQALHGLEKPETNKTPGGYPSFRDDYLYDLERESDAAAKAKIEAEKIVKRKAAKDKIKKASEDISEYLKGGGDLDNRRKKRGILDEAKAGELADTNVEGFYSHMAAVKVDMVIREARIELLEEAFQAKSQGVMEYARSYGFQSENINELNRQIAAIPAEHRDNPIVTGIRTVLHSLGIDRGHINKEHNELRSLAKEDKGFETQRRNRDLAPVPQVLIKEGFNTAVQECTLSPHVIAKANEKLQVQEAKIDAARGKFDAETQINMETCQELFDKLELKDAKFATPEEGLALIAKKLDSMAPEVQNKFKNDSEFMDRFNDLKEQYPNVIKSTELTTEIKPFIPSAKDAGKETDDKVTRGVTGMLSEAEEIRNKFTQDNPKKPTKPETGKSHAEKIKEEDKGLKDPKDKGLSR